MTRRPSYESTNLAGVESLFHNVDHSLKIKLPPMNPNPNQNLRRSGRHRTASSGASGSEYLASEKSVEMQREPTPEPPVEFTHSIKGRRVAKRTYVESSDSEAAHPEELFDEENPEDRPRRSSRSTRTRRAPLEDEDEEEAPVRRQLRSRNHHHLNDFIVLDDDDKMHTTGRYPTRNRSKKASPQTNVSSKPLNQQPRQSQPSRRLTRRSAAALAEQEGDFFPDQHTSSGASADADGSLDDAPHTSSDIEPEPEPELEHEPEPEEEVDGRPYSLRQRQKINYAIPPPLEDMPKPSKNAGGRNGGRAGGYHGGGHGRAGAKGRTLGWSANGAELGRWMGMPGDDSVTIFFVPLQACY